jgi:hypothetical protein
MFRSEVEIRIAINECLSQCHLGGQLPLASISRFTSELRQMGWCESDVHAVENAVRRTWLGVLRAEDSNEPSDVAHANLAG